MVELFFSLVLAIIGRIYAIKTRTPIRAPIDPTKRLIFEFRHIVPPEGTIISERKSFRNLFDHKIR